jgi:benzoyl-CoA-dihydrodiol lyase
MNVSENAGTFPGYELKLNSYDIGVDIELHDAVQRLRFEHPEVKAVILTSGRPGTFCAGANIRMLGTASHIHKVNFCKFTNETRLAIEDAGSFSGQRYLAALNGTAAGGGYELALAADRILLVDDGNAAVSLPEVPMLAVLPGTGGLTRLVDKRRVRRDLADVFCTVEEGVKGKRAVEWRLVDEIVPKSRFVETAHARALELARRSDRPSDGPGVALTPLPRTSDGSAILYPGLRIQLDRGGRAAHLTLDGPKSAPPETTEQAMDEGPDFWPLALARALDDALLHLRFNEPEAGTLIFHAAGNMDRVIAFDDFLRRHAGHWWIREITLYLKRTLKRLDLTSRTIFALVEQGSCYGGFLAEILFAADRALMLDGQLSGDSRPAPSIRLSGMNFGPLPMSNGLTRIQTRFLGDASHLDFVAGLVGRNLGAGEARDAGLVTLTPDSIDWNDDIRLLLEERASFSPDALTGMEANLRFAGPETMETRIFSRLSVWQNWIFQRPNAVGAEGALPLYGTGRRPAYDARRV